MSVKGWQWVKVDMFGPMRTYRWGLFDGRNRERASIWPSPTLEREVQFTWHTFDDDGVGGENDVAYTLIIAQDACVAAIVRQGWAPGGWKVIW